MTTLNFSFKNRWLLLPLMLLTLSVESAWADTYEQLTSIANIDESAEYVLGIDGTGFHYSGTSNWGLTALPSAQTPLKYKLKKANDGNSFTASTTISSTKYYLQVPTSNTFGMATSTGTNTDLIIGTTQVSSTNYAVTNKNTTTRHLRVNGSSGLRSYAGTTGSMAFFYKVVSAVPRTVSWSVNKTPYTTGNPSTSVNSGSKVTKLPTAPDQALCDGSKVFVGWSAHSINGSTNTRPTDLFLTAEDAPTVTADVTYYAVFATETDGGTTTKWVKTNISDVEEGTYALITTGGKAFTGTINNSGHGTSTSSTFSFDANNEATSAPSGTCEIQVQAVTGGFKMYNSSKGYLYAAAASSGNLAWHNTENSYWRVLSGGANIVYNSNTAYLRVYDNTFRTYSSSTNNAILFAQKVTISNKTYSNYATSCCNSLGSIKGSVSLSQLATPDPTKLKATWTMNATTGIASYDLEVYNSSNVKVKTINNYTSGSEITGLAPCTTYYVKLYTVSSGGSYCDGGLISTSSTCTTNSYNVSFSGCSNVTNNGEATTCAAADYSVTFAGSSARYALPENVTSVTIGGVAKTQGTHFTWNQGTGVLTIPQANITGNIVIDVDGVDQGACESTPVLGAASLSGTFSLTNVGVTCASITPGDYCDVTEYGFIWYEGTGNKEIGGSGVTKVTNNGAYTSGAFVNTLTKNSFTAETTYTFRAYATNSGGLTGYSAAASFTPYTVSYNKNDESATGTVATVVVNAGGSVTLPNASAFSLDCNDMTKWALNSAEGTQYDPEATYSNINENATFYALWNKRTYTVQYAAGTTPVNGGAITGSHVSDTKTCGKNLTLPDTTFRCTGYKQTGWTKSDGGNQTNGLKGTYSSNQAQIFYPVWTINTYTIYKGEKTGCSDNDFTVASSVDHYGSVSVTASPDAAHKGSPVVTIFPEGNGSVSGTTISNITGNITVSVSFAAKQAATVKLHVAGTESVVVSSALEDDSYTLPAVAAECPDLGLYGWYKGTYSHATTAPSGDNFKTKGQTVQLTAGENKFYAVYATMSEEYLNTFAEITSESALTSDQYLIGALTGPWCMKTSKKDDTYMNEIGMSSYNNDGTIDYNSNEDIVWVISRDGDNVTIKGNDNNKYLAINNGSLELQDGAYSYTFDYGTTKTGSWSFKSVSASTQQLIYNGWSGFTAGTAQSSDVSLYKRNKQVNVSGPYTTSPNCTTHELTYTEPGTEGTVVLGKETLGEGKITTATATPSEHYTFSHWTISGTGASLENADGDGKSTDNPVTVTMGTADAEITAHFTEKEKCTVEFYNNGGSALSSTTYWLGENPSAPTLKDGTTGDGNACDATSDTHYGWTQTAWQQTITKDDVDAKTAANVKVYTKGSTLPAIEAGDNGKTIKYYAVWAHAEDNSVQKNYTLSLTSDNFPSNYDDAWPNGGVATANEVGGAGTMDVTIAGANIGLYNNIQFKKSSAGYVYNTTDLGNITNIDIAGTTSLSQSIGTTENPSSGTSGGYFKIWNGTGNAQNTTGITINFTKTVGDIAYSAFLTNCCNQLENINGEVEFTDPTTAVVTWDKLENVAATNAYVVSYRTGDAAYGTTNVGAIDLSGAKATCTITDLSCNTSYDFKIAVTAATGYCDKEQVIEGQNSGKYAIALNGNGTVTGGTFEADATDACDDATITLSADKSTGYNFSSWAISDGSSNITADVLKDGYEATDEIVEITMPAKDITVNASFSAISYTILYENMDGATNHVSNPSSYTVEDAISLGDPTKESFNFGGWFINSDLAAGHEAGSPAIAAGSTGNKTFYAKWIADDKWSVAITAPSHGTITVSWNGGVNSFNEGSQNIEKNTDIIITATPSAGYELTSLKIGDADFESGNTHKLTSSIVISATFSIINYTISYENMEGATNHEDNVASYTIESEDVYLYEALKTGYTFGGWFTDNNVWSSEVIAIEHGSTGNVVVYAKWTAKQSTITWDANGGSVDPTSSSYTYDGDAVELPIPTREHYTFDGWFTAAEGGTQITEIGTENKPEADVTYHAHWTEITYTVKWSVNADDTYAEGDPTTSVTYNSKVTTLPTAPTSAECDDAKKFVGWRAEKITGTSAAKPDGIFTDIEHSPKITQNTTFYAVFATKTVGQSVTLSFPDDNSANNGLTSNQYTSTWTATSGTYSWSISNFNNNNWLQDWAYIKCGRKNNASTGTITTSSAIGFPVDTVIVSIGGITAGSVNSAKLYISSASNFETKASMDIEQSTGVKKLVIASPAKDMYYQIEYDCASASSNGIVQIDAITYKQKTVWSDYVTKCASCDDDPTFTTALPAISAEDGTSATVTATGGLATLGSEGCNISDYGFVLGTATDPELDGEDVTKLQVGTSNPTIGADFAQDLTGLTKGTHYYVRAYAVNKHGVAYSSTKDFWTKDVSSIAVTTAPTKTKYIIGEAFDATGMVVTATMADGSEVDVTEDVTYSTSAFNAAGNVDFPINYSLCETNVQTTQPINVYSVTVNEGTDPSKGDMTYDNAGTITISNLASHTTVEFVKENAEVHDNGDGTFSIINPTGTVSITVNYVTAVEVDVKFFANGTPLTDLALNPYQSENFDMPDASAVANAMTAAGVSVSDDVHFVGWSANEFPYQTIEPTMVAETGKVTAATNYYAVFSNIQKVRIDEGVITGSYQSNETEVTEGGFTFVHKQVMKNATTRLQFKKDNSIYGYVYNKTAISNIVRIEVGVPGGTYRGNIPVYACSAKKETSGSALVDEDTADDRYIYLFPANMQYFWVKGNNDDTYNVDYIDIYYAEGTGYYTTQFSTLTFNKADGTVDKTEIVAKNKAYELTADNTPTEVEHYTFLDKWTDSQNTYEIGDAVTMSTNVTLTPISAYETTGDTDIDGLPESVTEIVVNVSKELNVNDDRTINTLTIKSTSGAYDVAGTSGQVTGEKTLTVSDNLFLEIKLRDGDMDQTASQKWYCISAPFEVAINGGFFWGDGTPMVLNTHFQLFEWDGDRRATGASGWRRTSSNMKAHTAYFIGFDDERIGNEPGMNQNTIKLKALDNTISNVDKVVASEHTGSGGDDYANWNGLANPNFYHVTLDKDVHAFNYNKQTYATYDAGDYNFVVGTPFFLNETGDITISVADNTKPYRAPKREGENYKFRVRIGKSGAEIADNHVYVRASETASASYEKGHDVITMNGTTASSALIWTENYGGKRLAIEEAPLINGTASYVLTLSAPANGTYSISVAAPQDNADLYLTYDGTIIWNLSESAYTVDLNKGITNGYGLLLRAKAPAVVTGVDQIDAKAGAQKVIIDEHVYILRGGQMYDVNGKIVK